MGDTLANPDDTRFEIVSGFLKICTRSGFSMMSRFDSKVNEWWNPAQAKLLATDEYQEICKDIEEEHGKI